MLEKILQVPDSHHKSIMGCIITLQLCSLFLAQISNFDAESVHCEHVFIIWGWSLDWALYQEVSVESHTTIILAVLI